MEDNKILFFDELSGRYFYSDTGLVDRVQRKIERIMNANDKQFISLNDYYSVLGLPQIDGGDTLGFKGERYNRFKFVIDFNVLEDNTPYAILNPNMDVQARD